MSREMPARVVEILRARPLQLPLLLPAFVGNDTLTVGAVIQEQERATCRCSASPVGETPVDLRCHHRAVPFAIAERRIVAERGVRCDSIVVHAPPRELLEHRGGGAEIRAAHVVPLQGVRASKRKRDA